MILVSGGTGFVGSAVVKYLLDSGEEVAVLGRDASKIRSEFSRVEPRQADVREPSTLTQAMEGIDVVVNTVQFPTSPIEVPRKGWTFEAIDYQGTVNQIEAAKAAGVRRFVYVSGVGAGPNAEKHWFRYKYQAEQHLQAERPRVGHRAAHLGIRTRRPRPEPPAGLHEVPARAAAVRRRQAGHAAGVHRRCRRRGRRFGDASPRRRTSSSSSAGPRS